jgi:formate hydrogenlyase subunit 3/multisubunit Na+/H+ antiporter MnhD subunit
MSATLFSLPPALMFLGSGFGVWTLGGLTAFFSGEKAKHHVFSTVMFLGSLSLLLAMFLGQGDVFSVTLFSPINFVLAPLAIRIEPLNSLFLVLLGIVSGAVAIFSAGYLNHFQERIHAGIYWACVFIYVTSMGLVLISSNAIVFLIFWELMALSSVALVASDHVRQRAQRAALIYLGSATVSGALLTGGFLWYFHIFKSWDFSEWHNTSSTLGPALLVFFAIAVKSGLWPFHIWMPYAQSEAPSPVAALMSGAMKKVAMYAFIRLLLLNSTDGVVIGYLALFLGTVSVLWGILFALIERDLKRLLAYSTVEQMGLIVVSLGLVLLCRHNGLTALAGIAFAAALLTCINHSIFKTLLFLGAGCVDVAAGTRDLSVLGALGKKMPFTMCCFLIGSLSIAALPPFNGFANKWLIYQSFFQYSFSSPQVIDRAVALLIVGVLAFVGALSVACYTKAVGICFLGRPRSEAVAHAKESSRDMVAAQVLLAAACVFTGLFIPQILNMIVPVLSDVIGTAPSAKELFPLPIWKLALLGGVVFAGVYALVFKNSPVSKFVTWDCGYGDLPGRAEETSTSFSEPIARIFAPLLQYRISTEIKGRDRRHFPEVIKFETNTKPILEERLYRPTIALLQGLSKGLAQLQTGSIHLYLLYVFITLLILVGIGIRL